MLLIAWGEGSSERVTRDADLLGFGDNSPPVTGQIFREICQVNVDDDGAEFEIESIAAEEIRSAQEAGGVRVTFRARIGNARIPVQADIGFGDAFTTESTDIVFPSLLAMPKPVLKAYTKESALAEKFEAIAALGERNSRMKDYFDIWLLSNRFEFSGERLASAIRQTFSNRNTEIPTAIPVGLSLSFATDKDKQWKAFWQKTVRTVPIPNLPSVVEHVGRFFLPAAQAAQSGRKLQSVWPKGGLWHLPDARD